MCTAISYRTKDHYFGRTLDYDMSYTEEVTVTPRRYPFSFREDGVMAEHYAMIGMAYVVEGYPLYYDAVNEKGLGMAGLNFVGNARYQPLAKGKRNIAPFELIPWVLGQCGSVKEAKELLLTLNLTDIPFNSSLPTAELHWMIADREEQITVEATTEGLQVYPNPVGVLTNNPPFPQQLFALNNYRSLSPRNPENRFSDKISLEQYSNGMGGLGLPGDLSSTSRFVRAAFVKLNAVSSDAEAESVGQFFHILDTVSQPRGCCIMENGGLEITLYTACCNTDRGIYYYTTYGNRQITAVDMREVDLDKTVLDRHPLIHTEQIYNAMCVGAQKVYLKQASRVGFA